MKSTPQVLFSLRRKPDPTPMKVVDKDISELIPSEYNPRYISDDAFEHLKASLQRFKAVEPIVVNNHKDRKNIIVGGHQRVKAAKALGWETFPCVEVSLDRDQERELNIRLNKNTGAWDWDELANFFDVEELTDWGFTDDELFGGQDFSGKNKEIDIDELDGTMTIKLNYTEDEYWQVKEQLSKIAETPEQAVWKLLGNE